MKPYFSKKSCGTQSKIILQDNDKIVTKNVDVAEVFNKFFVPKVTVLKQEKEIKVNQTVISCLRKQIAFSKLTQKPVTDSDQFSTLPMRSRNCSTLVCPSVDLQCLWGTWFL